MVQDRNVDRGDDHSKRHLTTRRGFVTAVGFGVVSLYGLWAAYGAVPTSLSLPSTWEALGEGGMHGMVHGGGGEMSPEEFRRRTEAFIEANSLPDGSVKPARRAMAGISAAAEQEREAAPADEREGEHEAAKKAMVMAAGDEHDEGAEPVDVYMMASRYSYEPSVLRLEANVPYRFLMMAMDTNHGISINIRAAGHIMRRPARTLTEMTMTFTNPGVYLVYCTVYCGEGHDMMKGSIIVE